MRTITEDKKVYIMIGPPGCGKSFWAKKQNLKCISSDGVREEITGSENDMSKDGYVWKVIENRFSEYCEKGYSFVFDATNIMIRNRSPFRRKAESYGYKVIAVDVFSGLSEEECILRNNWRNRVVPEEVIKGMIKKFVPPTVEEGFSEIITVNKKEC